MNEFKDPDFCLNVLGQPKDSQYVKELFEETTEFFVGDKVKIAVHKVQVQKVTDLIFLVEAVPRVVQNVFRQIKFHRFCVVLVNLLKF